MDIHTDNSTFPKHIVFCRAGLESALREEVLHKDPCARIELRAGYIISSSLPGTPLVFEWQRMENSKYLPNAELNPLTASSVEELFSSLEARKWIQFIAGENSELKRKGDGLARAFTRLAKKSVKRFREPRTNIDWSTFLGQVFQVYREEGGAWLSLMEVGKLTDPHPAGVHRMKRIDGAPSRSYLKLEEAFKRMDVAPQSKEKVVDLGAAPGGWTFACLQRGADVVAVDRGPLRLPNLDPLAGAMQHLREDGVTYCPETPVQWMISDMLIPPGQAMSLLKRWMKNQWAVRIVCNIKIPQHDPYVVVKPLEDLSELFPEWCISIRHLYHDRREVTVMASQKLVE